MKHDTISPECYLVQRTTIIKFVIIIIIVITGFNIINNLYKYVS